MKEDVLTVREIQKTDIPLIMDYWLTSEKSHLINMGVDPDKIPSPEGLANNLLNQIETPIQQRNSYCIIWQLNGEPVGHSNTNPTDFGNDAFMHLHIWKSNLRKKGMGFQLLKMTLPHFFENLKLKNLYSQPFALNIAPHKTLEKVGFKFVKEYITIPGSINYEQSVKLWHLSYEKYCELNKTVA